MIDAVYVHAQQSMAVGSKSFDMASRLFDADTRRSALMLYSWCRYCDDVIDGQVGGFVPAPAGRGAASDILSPCAENGSAHERLAYLKAHTLLAFDGAPMHDPAFAALQEVARKHAIPVRLALDHLAGYEMDVAGHAYETLDDTLLYCYRVAGVVGLMMAAVLNVRDPQDLDRACDLGLAFQLTNIARDIADDASIGRCYLPQDWLDDEGLSMADIAAGRKREGLARIASRLVAAAEPYYESARSGLAAMPVRSAWAVATAHGVYRAIGRKVQAKGATAWDARVSTTKTEKLVLLVRGAQMALRSRITDARARPPTLWTRRRA